MSADFIWKLWNQKYGLAQENFYSNLLHTSRNLLDFKTPQGLQMNFTSCPSGTFANSHRLTVFPNIGGSLAFLHSSRPFIGYRGTREVPLTDVLEGYQPIHEAKRPEESYLQEIWQGGKRIDVRDTLLFGRLHLPRSRLEAIFARRLSPERQLIITALSSATLPNGGTIFAQLQQDRGTHTNEYIYNTDDALIGFRHMRQLGSTFTHAQSQHSFKSESPESPESSAGTVDLLSELPFRQKPEDLPLSAYGKFSAGFEIYYGALHKSGGLSCGMRFATLPSYHGHPTTMTLTVNPLVGHLSSTYTLQATGYTTLCSKLDFNIFSYESDLTLGGEVWQYPSIRSISPKPKAHASQQHQDAESESLSRDDSHKSLDPMSEVESGTERLGFEASDGVVLKNTDAKEEPSGVIKAYLHSATLQGGLLWEGRVKDFLVSFGGKFDLKQRAFGTAGVEIQYGA